MTVTVGSADLNKHWWALLKAWIWNCSTASLQRAALAEMPFPLFPVSLLSVKQNLDKQSDALYQNV